MLHDPRKDRPIKQPIVEPSLDGFISFVAARAKIDGKRCYDWDDPDECPVGRYLQSLGQYDPGWDYDKNSFLTMLVEIARGDSHEARCRRWTYRALLRRLMPMIMFYGIALPPH